MTERIPMLSLDGQIEELWPELEKRTLEVLRSGRFILGPNVEAFEREAASYLGTSHAIGLASGTDGLVIGLEALGVGPGCEVITTPFTFFATAEAILRLGAVPIFVDIDPVSFNLDPRGVEAAIGERTRVILPVHLYGRPADMQPLLELASRHGLRVFEDAAQAFGATYGGRKAGALGCASAFSFFPSKNLGAFGDAGMLATNDDTLAERVRLLRNHGQPDRYSHVAVGYNSRLDELQATFLRLKLERLDAWNDARRRIAALYCDELANARDLVLPTEAEGSRHIYHQFTVRILGGRRNAVQSALDAAGISSVVYYPNPLHRLPLYDHQQATLPEAERAAEEVLSLPIWPELEPATAARIARTLTSVLS